MKDRKDFLKTKSVLINSDVFKSVCKLDITLNEFLLLLYFINVDNHLDLDRVKVYLDLGNEEIFNIYTSLINKGLIEVKVNKVNNTIDEEVSLDLFYDKLIMKGEERAVSSDVYSLFESEFGRTLSPIEYETISKWISSGIEEDTIKSALKEAVINGVSNLKYIDRILYEWTKKGKNKSLEETRDFKDLFDYNWLDEK